MVLTHVLSGLDGERETGQYSGTAFVCAVTHAWFQTLRRRLTVAVTTVNEDKSREYRNDENLIKLQNSRVLPCSAGLGSQ